MYKILVKNPNGGKTFEIVDVWFASAYYIFQTGQAKTFPQGLKMKAFGDNPLSRVRSVCDGSYTCERDDTDGCNGYGPSGQTQNGVLPISGCSGKMTYILLQSNPSSPRQCQARGQHGGGGICFIIGPYLITFAMFVANNFLDQMVSFGICLVVIFSHDKIFCLKPSKQPWALANL